MYVCTYARRRRARARPTAMSRWAIATATATRRPWTCASVIASLAVACGVGALVGGLARFDPPRAREWVIAKDEATTRADAGEAAVAMLGECVDGVLSSRSRARGAVGAGLVCGNPRVCVRGDAFEATRSRRRLTRSPRRVGTRPREARRSRGVN